MKSWKSTLAGVLAIVSAAIALIAVPWLDADPATVPRFGEFFPIAIAGMVGLFARDHDVTSEQAGIK